MSRWQAQALSTIADSAEFLVLNCSKTPSRRQPVKHALYYALNLICLKSPWTRQVPVPLGLAIRNVVDFEAEVEGAWQRLPHHVLGQIKRHGPDCLIKFGMGLLRMPSSAPPILSYHHGDPRSFRGRPAGFYELLSARPAIGQVIQTLTDRLDAGTIVAFAETKAYAHSYKRTMMEAFSRSPLLLKSAIEMCVANKLLPLEPTGKNYTLPRNSVVLKFAAGLLAAKIRRLFYGLFIEKQWEVAEAEVDAKPADKETFPVGLPERSKWTIVQRPSRYRFVADPFPHPAGGLLVEALRRSDEQGEILHIDASGERTICTGPGHFSYPATIEVDDRHYLIPEIAEWSSPRLYALETGGAKKAVSLNLSTSWRILDPTLYRAEAGLFSLFGNRADEGPDVLRLWTSPDLFGQFEEHPASPIRISPLGSRMAGSVLRSGGTLYRLGQDCSRGYGDGLIAFSIERLTTTEYSEAEAGRLKFADLNGPHTLNCEGGHCLFDFYTEQVSALAGARRIRALISKRRARRTVPTT